MGGSDRLQPGSFQPVAAGVAEYSGGDDAGERRGCLREGIEWGAEFGNLVFEDQGDIRSPVVLTGLVHGQGDEDSLSLFSSERVDISVREKPPSSVTEGRAPAGPGEDLHRHGGGIVAFVRVLDLFEQARKDPIDPRLAGRPVKPDLSAVYVIDARYHLAADDPTAEFRIAVVDQHLVLAQRKPVTFHPEPDRQGLMEPRQDTGGLDDAVCTLGSQGAFRQADVRLAF